MWVLSKMVSLQMWKHHIRTSFKRILSRTTIHMHARPTSNICIFSIRSRRNKRTKREVWTCKRKTNRDGKDLWWIKSKIPKETKNSHQFQREIDRLNLAKQT